MRRSQALLGLVGRTAAWPQRLEAWSTGGAVPSVSYCESVAHLQARLQAERGATGVLLDGDLSLVDRDLIADISATGGLPVVVEGPRRRRDWPQLGAAAVLPTAFDREQFERALAPLTPAVRSVTPRPPMAPVVAVTGPGGTGVSVIAIALAQGLAAIRRRVLLVDCCLHAEQAMLHNAHGSQPCLTDVVELHAEGTPDARHVRQLALGIVERGYYLLLGIRRARQWSRIRASSLQPALRSLRSAFDVVVADVDADVEGEADGGSVEVEERNLLARTIMTEAEVVVIVGQPTMKGVYALVRTMIELLEFGVRPERLLPVINQAAPSAEARAELGRAVRHLLDTVAGGPAISPVLFAPNVGLEDRLRERDALPDAMPSLLAGAVGALLDRGGPARNGDPSPARIAAGSLGHWSDGTDAER